MWLDVALCVSFNRLDYIWFGLVYLFSKGLMCGFSVLLNVWTYCDSVFSLGWWVRFGWILVWLRVGTWFGFGLQ